MQEQIQTTIASAPNASPETSNRADHISTLRFLLQEVRTFRLMLEDLRQAQRVPVQICAARH